MDHISIKILLNQGTTTERTRITNSNALRTKTLPGWRASRQGEFLKEQGCQPSHCAADFTGQRWLKSEAQHGIFPTWVLVTNCWLERMWVEY